MVEIRGSDIRPVIVSSFPSQNHTDFLTSLKAFFSLFEAILHRLKRIDLPTLLCEDPKLVSELKELEVLDQDLDPQEVVSGRNLVKKLFELSEGELEKLLNIFEKYCS